MSTKRHRVRDIDRQTHRESKRARKSEREGERERSRVREEENEREQERKSERKIEEATLEPVEREFGRATRQQKKHTYELRSTHTLKIGIDLPPGRNFRDRDE